MAYILVVDDDGEVKGLIYDALSKMGHTICEVTTGNAAVGLCQKYGFDLIILDYQICDADGFEVARYLGTKSPLVFHTNDSDDDELQKEAINIGALGVIQKISNIESFRREIDCFLKQIQN